MGDLNEIILFRWRLIFLGLETAFEDTMVSVIIPLIGEARIDRVEIFGSAWNFVTHVMNSSEVTLAALLSVITIAIGKLGGLMAGYYMTSRTDQYPAPISTKRLFVLVLISSLALLQVPWGYNVIQKNWSTELLATREIYVAVAMILNGVLLFFIFSAAPKIG